MDDAMSPSPAPSMDDMGHDMGTMDHSAMGMGPDILPGWVTWLWLIALAAVLVLHCAHLVRAGGQHRWFHGSHILMLVSMLYMYASMEFRWTWFPSQWWVAIFAVSTAAIVAWMAVRLVQRHPFSALWILALIMQASMIYMWLPDWLAAFTWLLVVYFLLETIAWLIGIINDSHGKLMVGPGDRAGATSLAHPGLVSNVSMAIMAASMAYMFAAMQFMR